jgi:DNA-binding NarL/FixJ family response regulator
VRVVLVDDHALFRMGVRQILAHTPGFDVVGEACTARDAFKLVDSLRPDLVLMDIALPGMDGVVATREIGRRSPSCRVLIVSAHEQVNDVVDALAAGAAGYALKCDSPDALLEAIGMVMKGERYIAPVLAGRLAVFEGRRRPAADVLDVLSAREREVFRLAAECVPAREMARELCIARKTVDTHLNRINRKLGLRNIAELVRLAANLGMLHSGRTPSPIVLDAEMPPASPRQPGEGGLAREQERLSVPGRGGEDILRTNDR